MFNFNERTMGEKVVMIGAGALVVGNTTMNIINAVKINNVKKRVNTIENNINEINKRLDEITTVYHQANAINNAATTTAMVQQQAQPPVQQGGQQ